MSTRKEVMDTIRYAIRGLPVTVNGTTKYISVAESVFDPVNLPADQYPKFAVVPGPDPIDVGLYGFTLDHASFQVDMFGYVDAGFRNKTTTPNISTLYAASESIIEIILAKLINPTWIALVACAFSILKIGPITSEYVDGEFPLGYISIPLSVSFLDDGSSVSAELLESVNNSNLFGRNRWGD
jgi:hypothetical protein